MGEAVVDVLPAADGLWRPVPGGSSFNVALALGRLGAPAAFVGRLSNDEQGRRMAAALSESGVDLDLVSRDDRSSPLSFIESGSQAGSARYAIYLAGTAHDPPTLPRGWLADAALLHVSSFSAIAGAWGEAVVRGLDEAAGIARRSFDLNIRPALLPPREQAAALVEDRLRRVEIVKASNDDLAWLFPQIPPHDVAREWSRRHGLLALLTEGAGGATAFAGDLEIHRPARSVDIVDTVGAGDAFVAAFLSRGLATGVLDGASARDASALADLLDFANAAAALCCARAGADSATTTQVVSFLQSSSA